MAKDSGKPTIVVGVDGSKVSKEALAWAAKEAKLRGTRLHVVETWSLPTGVAGSVGAAPVSTLADPQVKQEAKAQLAKTVKEALGDKHGLDVQMTVVAGNPARVLMDVADQDDAELLVVGSRGRGGFKKLLLGSVSEQCVTHSKKPVAVIHPSG